MEIYDILMLVVLLGAMIFGAIKGFAWQLASLASITISYVVAYRYREPFSQSIQADPPWNRFLAMLILYIGTSLVIWVAFRMIRGSIDRLKLREFDRQVGALFGLAKGALYCTLITLFAVTLLGDSIRESIVRSKSGNYIAKVLDRSDSVIPEELHDVVQPYLDRFDEEFHHDPNSKGILDRQWLANGAEEIENRLTGNSTWDHGLGSSDVNTPQPNAPAQWMPQQAQTPSQQSPWNGFQR